MLTVLQLSSPTRFHIWNIWEPWIFRSKPLGSLKYILEIEKNGISWKNENEIFFIAKNKWDLLLQLSMKLIKISFQEVSQCFYSRGGLFYVNQLEK